ASPLIASASMLWLSVAMLETQLGDDGQGESNVPECAWPVELMSITTIDTRIIAIPLRAARNFTVDAGRINYTTFPLEEWRYVPFYLSRKTSEEALQLIFSRKLVMGFDIGTEERGQPST
ncbi:MAG TPA: hypothetical protein VHN12_12985, partial [Geobacteraceae bacterium]|nr:hypothetical protein [Geobacteraceae bacterium]